MPYYGAQRQSSHQAWPGVSLASRILMESSGYVLLENGNYILME